MKDQIILVVDNNGVFDGEYITKEAGHKGKGMHHLAITVLVQNNQNQVLLQKRKHQIFDNIWDMTASTHPLHLDNGNDETTLDATLRALKDEYGIEQLESLEEIGAINYFAQDNENCENEHDVILIGRYNGPINLNSEAAYGYEWVDRKTFLLDIEQNSSKYSPWALEATKLLKEKSFFN